MKVEAGRRPMAEINVTPLVDVVLVLLIIFMVTAPFLQGGLEVDLPKVASHGLDVHEGLIVSVRRGGTIAVGDAIVPSGHLEDALARANASRRPVFLKADQSVPYGQIVALIARLRNAGVASLGLVTQPQPPAKAR
ncbi:MAG TPA: biopolymer transporter ExbD [Candidatus Eisenbacteria bacterium]|nr:biopolymer transporter ExbD [Candidatus Eisenbacteria bacterium]